MDEPKPPSFFRGIYVNHMRGDLNKCPAEYANEFDEMIFYAQAEAVRHAVDRLWVFGVDIEKTSMYAVDRELENFANEVERGLLR